MSFGGPRRFGARLAAAATCLGRATAERLRRFAGANRVLQVEEVRAAVAERIAADALTGLRRRYLPSGVTVLVSPEDHRFLLPFERELSDVVRDEADRRAASAGWAATASSLAVDLGCDQALGPGSPPVVQLGYPPPRRRAEWQPEPAARTAAGQQPTLLALVLTVAVDGGTALQEEVHLHLGPEAPENVGAGVDPEVGAGFSRRPQTAAATPPPTQSPSTPSALVHLPPPTTPPFVAILPSAWDQAWAVLPGSGAGPRLLWCPGGVALVGRSAEAAHLVPASASPVLSRCHLAFWRDPDGRLLVADLGSTNGTWLAGQRLAPGEPVPLPVPAALAIGDLGRLMVEIR